MPSAPRSSPEASPPVLLLTRPAEDCAELCDAARAMGFAALVAPLMTIVPLPPAALPVGAEALLLTSARSAALAARAWGRAIGRLPVYAVGPATARAAQAAGLHVTAFGDRDASAILALAGSQGHRRILHAGGQDKAPLAIPPGVTVESVPLYEARAQPLGDEVLVALGDGRIFAVLLFSPRTARLFRRAVDLAAIAPDTLRLVTISDAAATAAGAGWRKLAVADDPRSDALLAAARRMWQGERQNG